jgi:hypothetical protein
MCHGPRACKQYEQKPCVLRGCDRTDGQRRSVGGGSQHVTGSAAPVEQPDLGARCADCYDIDPSFIWIDGRHGAVRCIALRSVLPLLCRLCRLVVADVRVTCALLVGVGSLLCWVPVGEARAAGRHLAALLAAQGSSGKAQGGGGGGGEGPAELLPLAGWHQEGGGGGLSSFLLEPQDSRSLEAEAAAAASAAAAAAMQRRRAAAAAAAGPGARGRSAWTRPAPGPWAGGPRGKTQAAFSSSTARSRPGFFLPPAP